MTRFSRAIKARYDTIKRDIVEAADAVPESEYSFKPTPEVRSFGEIIGHIADTQNYFCGVAAGRNPQYADTNEKGAKTRPISSLGSRPRSPRATRCTAASRRPLSWASRRRARATPCAR